MLGTQISFTLIPSNCYRNLSLAANGAVVKMLRFGCKGVSHLPRKYNAEVPGVKIIASVDNYFKEQILTS